MVEIYTDGACSGNPGPGGWGAVLIQGERRDEIGGAEPQTTNNRMELRAAIEALRRLSPGERARLHTDSQYLLNGITRWITSWRRRGWLTLEGQPVENRDLWEQLDALAGDHVAWVYVRGHAGNPGNERANRIAQSHAGGGRGAAPQRAPSGPAKRWPSYLSLVRGELMRHATWDACRERVERVSGARYRKCADRAAEQAAVAAWGLPPEALERLG
jgi:ribonuclease HI